MSSEFAIETDGLAKRYRSRWALGDCTISVPRGSLSALVGANGAGKTTLLKLLAGLNRPTSGEATVLGRVPAPTAEYLADIGFLAQQTPLYADLTAAEHFAIAAHLDPGWDGDLATERLDELDVPLDRPAGKLSGGQRSQVGLALTLAKRPRLMLLDEPLAALDPLSRSDFLMTLTQTVADAEGELTVVMSSHLVQDLERVCDHVILLAAGGTQLCGTIDDIVASHRLFIGPAGELPSNDAIVPVTVTSSDTTTHVVAQVARPDFEPLGWRARHIDIEQIVLAYMTKTRGARVLAGGAR